MNRTYKVIWSKARRCYVVVSELAKKPTQIVQQERINKLECSLGGGI